MKTNNLQACVVGIGLIGPIHIEALRRIGINVIAVVSRNENKVSEFARSINAKYSFTNINEALKQEDIDVMHICVPDEYHYEYVKLSLIAGKHVVCEKPLAVNSKQSKELVSISKEVNKVCVVCYNLRYYPLVHHVKSEIKSNIIALHGGFLQDWLLYKNDWSWRIEQNSGSGLRAIPDIGSHWFDMVSFMTGLEVEYVFADLLIHHKTRHKPKGIIKTFSKTDDANKEYEEVNIKTEDFGSVLIRFKNGAKGVCIVSQVSAGRKCRLNFEIDTEEESFSWTSEDPNNMLIGKRNEPNKIITRDPSIMSNEANNITSYPGGHAEGYPDTFKHFFKAVYSYISENDYNAKKSFPTFEDGHKSLLICDAILKSATEERWVSIKEVEDSLEGDTL